MVDQIDPASAAEPDELYLRLQCPSCGCRVVAARCENGTCVNADGFPAAGGQLVLIDFESSIFRREVFIDGVGSVLPRDNDRQRLRSRIRDLLLGANDAASMHALKMLQALKAREGRPRLLVIGGGALGLGSSKLYEDEGVEIVGTDVYASPYTKYVIDGHRIPFRAETFDGVWIQAVLEHVLDPALVVAEIYRVLKPQGLIYADTPFMQQVHEGPYDFTRFSLSGHRWLFRQFDELESGVVGGAAVALVWSIRAFLKATGLGGPIATAVTLIFSPILLLDKWGSARGHADAASGVFFFGKKSDETLRPKDMVTYYENRTVR